MDFWINMAISCILAMLNEKTPNKLHELKRAMLKIRNKINEVYAGDPDFS